MHAVFEEGLVGTFIFSFTDDWFRHGYQIEDWAFGLTTRDRQPKPAFAAVREVFQPRSADGGREAADVQHRHLLVQRGRARVESCLRSMERLRYPNYEVIFVDDGSTDNTQEILRKFPWVRNIRQKNMGLSHARNVGMKAARGEVVVYTDSDCEVDEDWLYYLALSLVRSGHAGMGGPNLIPDEGSWVADCVGLSPGGPTHVMIDDRTAEHVPGCNMAFYTAVLKQVNGFDPQFRKAGDDVDVIWRIQNLGSIDRIFAGGAGLALSPKYRQGVSQAAARLRRGRGAAEIQASRSFQHAGREPLARQNLRRGSDRRADRRGRDLSRRVWHGTVPDDLSPARRRSRR